MKSILLVISAVLIAGCAMSGKINDVQLGMTKAEVIEVMGKPQSTSAQGGAEYMNYRLIDYYGGNQYKPYYVRLVNGRVESYGELGDFDSTKTDTVRIETDQNISIDEDSDLYTELRKLKQLLDDDVISESDYERLKQEAIERY